MRKQIAAANWKMNLNLDEGESLINQILETSTELTGNREVIFAVPFPYLTMAIQKISGKKTRKATAIHFSASDFSAFSFAGIAMYAPINGKSCGIVEHLLHILTIPLSTKSDAPGIGWLRMCIHYFSTGSLRN